MVQNMYIMAILASVIFLIPALLYLLRVMKDPFHPLIFVGTITFLITSGGILTHVQQLQNISLETQVIWFLFITILSVLGFYAGWFIHRWRCGDLPKMQLLTDPPQFDATKLFMWAMIFDLIGVTIYLYTREKYTITGYLYELGTLWLLGAMLSIQAFLLSPTSRIAASVTFLIALIPPLDRFFLYGQRGDTFRLAIVCLPIFFFKKFRPRPTVFIPAALALALIMGTLERTRYLMGTNAASSRLEAITQVIPSFFTAENDYKYSGSEIYVFGPTMIEAVRNTQSYEYGGWLYNIGVRFLPKELVENKQQYYTQWNVTHWIRNTKMNASIRYLAEGSAPSGYAHMFLQFGWAAPLFWVVLGYLIRNRYIKALHTTDIRQYAYLTAYFIIGMYLLSQDLYAATMNSVYIFPALMIAYHFSKAKQTLPVETGPVMT